MRMYSSMLTGVSRWISFTRQDDRTTVTVIKVLFSSLENTFQDDMTGTVMVTFLLYMRIYIYTQEMPKEQGSIDDLKTFLNTVQESKLKPKQTMVN